MPRQDNNKNVSAVQKARIEIRRRMFSYIAAGLGLVAGLAWNDGVKAVIDYFIPQTGSTVVAKLLYAFVVTSIVGIALYYLEKTVGEKKS